MVHGRDSRNHRPLRLTGSSLHQHRDAIDHRRLLRPLWGAFVIQLAGRLLDFWWHATHEEFETGMDQLQAHWLVWIGTVLVLVVAARALRTRVQGRARAGYLTIVVANALYVPIAVAHFIQHMNLQEVDWAHIGLAVTNVGSALGVLFVPYVSLRARH